MAESCLASSRHQSNGDDGRLVAGLCPAGPKGAGWFARLWWLNRRRKRKENTSRLYIYISGRLYYIIIRYILTSQRLLGGVHLLHLESVLSPAPIVVVVVDVADLIGIEMRSISSIGTHLVWMRWALLYHENCWSRRRLHRSYIPH